MKKYLFYNKGIVIAIFVLFVGIGVIPATTSYPFRENFDPTDNDAIYQISQFNPRDMEYYEHLMRYHVRDYDSRFFSKERIIQYPREPFGNDVEDSFYQKILLTDISNDGDYTPHDPINIQSDDDFTEENGVVGGNGTIDNPYTIEGWEINGSGYGIRIFHTTSHFIVRDCRLTAGFAIEFNDVTFGAISATITNGGDIGTYVRSSSNITIQDSMFYGRYGLLLYDSVFISVNNCNATSSSESGYGIRLEDLHFSILSNMTVSKGRFGILLFDCSNIILRDCDVFFSYYGIHFYRCQNLVLRNNSMHENVYNLGIRGTKTSHYYHDIDTTNSVNDKPVYFILNESDRILNGIDVGFLGLVGCTRISAEGLSIESNDQGLLLVETTNSSVASSTFSNNCFGIQLFASSDNTIADCRTLGENALYGIDLLDDSRQNHILDCEVWGGILLENAPFNVLRNNTITGDYLNFQVFGDKINDFIQDIDESNTINGKPIYYFVGEDNLNIYGSNIGYLGFVNCTNVKVHDITTQYLSQGLLLVNTKAVVKRCMFWACSWGVHLFKCSDVKIYRCSFKYNFCGPYLHYSSGNQIFMCDVSDNWWHGFLLENSDDNVIKRCKVFDTGMDSFFFIDSYENEVHYNNIAGSGQNGIFALYSTVNATNNWWGSERGPSGVGPGNGDSIGLIDADVAFEPWLKKRAHTFVKFLDIFLIILQKILDALKVSIRFPCLG